MLQNSLFMDNEIKTWLFDIVQAIKEIDNIRLRMVEYSSDYMADHWCDKGHIIFCIKGEMVTELKDGTKHFLKEGMVYFVGDNADSHRSSTEKGVTLFIVD